MSCELALGAVLDELATAVVGADGDRVHCKLVLLTDVHLSTDEILLDDDDRPHEMIPVITSLLCTLHESSSIETSVTETVTGLTAVPLLEVKMKPSSCCDDTEEGDDDEEPIKAVPPDNLIDGNSVLLEDESDDEE